MIPAGYLYKRIESKPDGLQARGVSDIYSLSGCVSKDFADYINFWKHNGYWLFDSPLAMQEIARGEGIDLSETTLVYYEAYEYEFDDQTGQWSAFAPEPSFLTRVQEPLDRHLKGFDVTTFSGHTSAECSPLSCNDLAETIPVNRHCLFDTFAEAKKALEQGLFKNSEPGPFRIFAVYTVHSSLTDDAGIA